MPFPSPLPTSGFPSPCSSNSFLTHYHPINLSTSSHHSSTDNRSTSSRRTYPQCTRRFPVILTSFWILFIFLFITSFTTSTIIALNYLACQAIMYWFEGWLRRREDSESIQNIFRYPWEFNRKRCADGNLQL